MSGFVSKYYDSKKIDALVNEGKHRPAVGGLWNEIGLLQFDILKSAGLLPGHAILDVGCGSLRVGRLLVEYLDSGNYFGTDLNRTLFEAGYRMELDDDLRTKLPSHHLVEHDVTEPAPFEQMFDYVMAFSLFTHLPAAATAQALKELRLVMTSNAHLIASFFICESDSEACQQGAGITSFQSKDPFHYSTRQLQEFAERSELSVSEDTSFTHPRGQRIFIFAPDNTE